MNDHPINRRLRMRTPFSLTLSKPQSYNSFN